MSRVVDATSRINSSGSRPNDLIFGAAVGYHLTQIEPFLESLRVCGYHGKTILMVDSRLARAIEKSRFSAMVTTHVVPQWIPFRFKLYKGRRKHLLYFWYPFHSLLWCSLQVLKQFGNKAWARGSLIKVADRLMAPIESRFLHALTVVRSGDYERILLTDVRDVFFQADPFAPGTEKGLYLGIESYPECLEKESHNERWIRMAYGEKMLARIGGRPISCAGVTLGDQVAMIGYLEKMSRDLLSLQFKSTKATMLISLDQAVHNKLIWTGEIKNYHLLRTGQSASLATLSDVSDLTDFTKLDGEGRLLDKSGNIISILHMYDRWPELKQTVLAQLK